MYMYTSVKSVCSATAKKFTITLTGKYQFGFRGGHSARLRGLAVTLHVSAQVCLRKLHERVN